MAEETILTGGPLQPLEAKGIRGYREAPPMRLGQINFYGNGVYQQLCRPHAQAADSYDDSHD
jgi:hypothetical protein